MSQFFQQYYLFSGVNIVWTLFIFFTGLCLGSFLNVVIWRVPQKLSVSKPRSFCPKCHHQITAWENIPVLSWLLLRGRCHQCHLPISPRYPLIEALTGGLFLLTWLLVIHFSASPYLFIRFALLIFWGIAFSMIDIDTQTVPTPMLYIAVLCATPLLFLPSSLPFENDFTNLISYHFTFLPANHTYLYSLMLGVLGILFGAGMLMLANRICSLFFPKTLTFGKGDIRYMIFIGLILGGNLVFFDLLIATLVAIVFRLFSKNRGAPIPMVPFFSISALIILAMTTLNK